MASKARLVASWASLWPRFVVMLAPCAGAPLACTSIRDDDIATTATGDDVEVPPECAGAALVVGDVLFEGEAGDAGVGSFCATHALKSLAGFDGLVSVSGSLYMVFNPGLVDISSLDGLGQIGGRLGIVDNGALTSLTGLEGVAAVGDWLIVQRNDALVSVSGLKGLKSVTGSLEIDDNDALADLSGLESLASVSGSVSIGYNAALASLAGLGSLTAVGGDITIGEDTIEWNAPCNSTEDNPNLGSLAGMNPKTIGGSLRVRCQTGLVDIDAFHATGFIGGDIEIALNPALSGLMGLGGSAGDLTSMGDASALRVLACKGGPLTQADYFEILVKVVTGDAPPFEFEAAECL